MSKVTPSEPAPWSGHLSGDAYVAARLRVGEDLRPGKYRKLLIRVKCDHVGTVCAKCAHWWNQDYQLYLTRTRGGRKMITQLAELGLPELNSNTVD